MVNIGDTLWVGGSLDSPDEPCWDLTHDRGWCGVWLECRVVTTSPLLVRMKVILPSGNYWYLNKCDVDNGWRGGWTTKDPTVQTPTAKPSYFYEVNLQGEWGNVPPHILEKSRLTAASYVRRTMTAWPLGRRLDLCVERREGSMFARFFWVDAEADT